MSVKLHPQYVVDEKGDRKSVLLDYAEFEEILELLRDQIDLAILSERIKNSGTPIPLRQVIAERKQRA
jgi:hypothetical protein